MDTNLSHTKGFSFINSRWMMDHSLVLPHFCYAHVYNHHLELGCEDDPATAPRGRSIYAHLPKSYFGQSKFLFTMEKQRLRRLMFLFFLGTESLDKIIISMSLPTITVLICEVDWTGINMYGSIVVNI